MTRSFNHQVGERLTSLPCPSTTRPVDTTHVTLSWEGLDKVQYYSKLQINLGEFIYVQHLYILYVGSSD